MQEKEETSMPELFTYDEVAKILQVSLSTVNVYTKRKNYPLKVIYLNPDSKKEPRIHKADLLEFLEILDDPREDV